VGYRVTFDGEITIDPPIRWEEITDSPFLPEKAAEDYYTGRDLMFRIAEEAVDVPGGRLYRRSAVALVPTWEDDAQEGRVVEHLQDAIDAFPGHEFTGRLDVRGEVSPDVWRLEVQDVHGKRKAVKVVPLIVWPNGDSHQADEGI
jgi:hypothetical protein